MSMENSKDLDLKRVLVADPCARMSLTGGSHLDHHRTASEIGDPTNRI